MLTASGDYGKLVECKIISLHTEKRSLAFLLSAMLFVVLSGCSTDYLAQVSCM